MNVHQLAFPCTILQPSLLRTLQSVAVHISPCSLPKVHDVHAPVFGEMEYYVYPQFPN